MGRSSGGGAAGLFIAEYFTPLKMVNIYKKKSPSKYLHRVYEFIYDKLLIELK